MVVLEKLDTLGTFVDHQFCELWLLGDDYDEFETLIAESLSPAEDDVTRLNEAVLEQLSSHQIERDKVEQVSVDPGSHDVTLLIVTCYVSLGSGGQSKIDVKH